MNYRELYQLFKQTIDELRTEKNANEEAVSNFQRLIADEKANVSAIDDRAEAKLVHFVFKDDVNTFLDSISQEFSIPTKAFAQDVSALISRRGELTVSIAEANGKIITINQKQAEINKTKSAIIEKGVNDTHNLDILKRVNLTIETVMERESATYLEIANAKTHSYISRFFNTKRYRLSPFIDKVSSMLSQVKNVETLSGVVFVDNPEACHLAIKKEIDIASKSVAHYSRTLRDCQQNDDDLKREERSIQVMTSELQVLNDFTIKKKIINLIINKSCTGKVEVSLFGKLGLTHNLKKKNASLNAIAALEKVVSGLMEQSNQIDKLTRQVAAPINKLEKAAFKAGSTRAKFDEDSFRNSIEPALKAFNNTNSWSKREHSRHTSGHYDYLAIDNTNMLLWLMISNSESNNMAPLILQGELSDIQASVVDSACVSQSLAGGNIDELSSVTIPMVDVPSINMSAIEVPSFSIPTIDIPTIDIPTGSYGGGGGGGGDYSGGSNSDTGGGCSGGD